jgi:Ca2+-binding RTX toxin-like protein
MVTRRLVVPLVLAAAAFQMAVIQASPAAAAITCGFSGAQVQISLTTGGSVGTVSVVGGAIQLNGVACGAATVNNTDTINVDGATGYQRLIISEAGGMFAPGKSDEPGSSDEIEFTVTLGDDNDGLWVVGTSGHDHIVLGAAGVNLNADETDGLDNDVVADVIANAEECQVSGSAGNDGISAAGGFHTGAGTTCTTTLFGGDGDDTLTGGLGTTYLFGDLGNDTMRAKGTASTSFRGGWGSDNQIGGAGNDGFVADDADGADVVDGGSGGFDTMTYYLRTSGRVKVTLDGIANDGDPAANGGAGEGDNVKNVDFLVGTPFDDILIGSSAAETFNGLGGKDTLNGKGGVDSLSGGTGDDKLTGGSGGDHMYGEAGADKFSAQDGEVDTIDGGVDADTDVCTCDPSDIKTNIP